MISVKILTNKEIAFGVYVLELPKVFSFIPGMVISIGVKDIAPRMYSIASGINEQVIRILFDIKPEGQLTNVLSKLEQGDSLTISEPFGNYSCNENEAYWIASGTGIAPFYSMYRSGLSKGKTIIHGGRSLHSFYFQEEFLANKNHNYIRCCSQEKGEGVYPGRLTSYLKEISVLPPNQKYYLCGSAEMVVETRDILIAKGIPFNNILAEIYF